MLARRTLFVETSSVLRDAEKELFIDARVEVDWKIRMSIDGWTGGTETASSTYKIRPIEHYPSELNEYGVLSNPDEIAWLDNAMTKPSQDHSYKSVTLIARVNQLGIRNTAGRSGFSIDVMTGVDADNFVAAEKRDAAIALAKKHWWQLALALLALWWWFFIRAT